MKRFLWISAAALGFLSPTCGWTAEKLFFQRPVQVDTAAPYPENIKNECALEMLLENYILSELGRHGDVQPITNTDQANGGKWFKVTILAVHGYGGGSWSGPKSLSMRVDVKQGDTTLKSTVLDRSSRGGFFGGMKGTCAILDRTTRVLAQDVGRWYFGAAPKVKQETTDQSVSKTE